MHLTPIIRKIMSILKKQGFKVVRIKGSHIVINRNPSLPRPIIIPNKKRLSNAVRLNLIKECKGAGVDTTKLENLF